MKTRIFPSLIILSILFAVVFSACDLNGEANYTPEIFYVHNPVRNHTDTLSSYYTDQAGVFRMDTINVGDTVLFYMYVEGYANNLTSFYITRSGDGVSELAYPDSIGMDSIFLNTSDYSKGKFDMDGTKTRLLFPFYYIALKASDEAKIKFAVISDAKFDTGFASNSNSFELKTPIVAASREDE